MTLAQIIHKLRDAAKQSSEEWNAEQQGLHVRERGPILTVEQTWQWKAAETLTKLIASGVSESFS